MSDMRKASIRLLYLELQKNAVHGYALPNVSELTETLRETLSELFHQKPPCGLCGEHVRALIERTLTPMNALYAAQTNNNNNNNNSRNNNSNSNNNNSNSNNNNSN